MVRTQALGGIGLTNQTLQSLGMKRLCEVVCQWEREEYGIGLHRQPIFLQAMLEKNANGMLCVFREGALAAYADVWQLDEAFYQNLKVGLVTEEQIRAAHILSPSDTPSGHWYIGSIITAPHLRQDGDSRRTTTLKAIYAMILGYSQGLGNRYSLLGVGSSEFGQKLMKKWHFQPVVPHSSAIDDRPRFERQFDNGSTPTVAVH